MNVTPEGTPLISRFYLGTLQRTEYFTLDRKPYAAHDLPQISGAPVADRPAATPTRPTVQRPREEPVVVSYSDARPRPTAWYFMVFGNPTGHGYFVGYDVLSRDRVGYIGRDGFQLALPADSQLFAVLRTRSNPNSSFIAPADSPKNGQVAAFNANAITGLGVIPIWICHVVSGDRLLRVDLRERSVRTVWETSGLFSVSVVQRPRRDSGSRANRQPEYEGCLVPLRRRGDRSRFARPGRENVSPSDRTAKHIVHILPRGQRKSGRDVL